LLPGGHPRKSSNKSKTKKDFAMSEEITTEEVVVEEVVSVDSEEISPEDTDLLEEVVEPTEEEQAAHDESFDSEEVKLEDEEIDWEILDLALQATMADAQLSTEQRKELPDSAFCGPDRSFPVPDCAHVTAARRLVGRAKVSGSVKQKIMGCVNSKAAKMKCDQSEDMSELENQLKDLQAKYDALEEKFKMVLENIAKTEDSEANISNDTENEENNASEVETVVEDSLNSNEEVSLTDVSVESPSVHTEDKEEKMTDKLKSLGSFEKKIVVEYRQILADQGELAAAHYFASKASYLPRGFNPNNF
jgi:outer membrane murein-binding lipoprotein Lpp